MSKDNNIQLLKLNKPIVYKQTAQIKSFDAVKNIVTGYLASFGTKDSDNDILIKGCFAKSLQDRGVNSTSPRKIAFCWQHDIKDPIGKFLVLEEDDKGLYFEAQLSDPDAVPNSKRAKAQYLEGVLNQHSIGYRYIWDKCEYDADTNTFLIKEVDLFEGSVVTVGCNENTPFTGMKSEQLNESGKQLHKRLNDILKPLEYATQIELKQLISDYISLNGTVPNIHTDFTSKPNEAKKVELIKTIQKINFIN